MAPVNFKSLQTNRHATQPSTGAEPKGVGGRLVWMWPGGVLELSKGERHLTFYKGINVWCGIINGHLIGPYFYEGILHSERYLQFLQEQLPVLLENVQLQLRANMCFLHDGAPPHKAGIVQQYLNETYGENWIGINEPIPWAPKSPDLTPLEFLWGTLKNKVYRTPSVNLEHLKEKNQKCLQ
ncbi:hypothetical protein NQ318_005059 [Aromia moschata]|uniref:Tc1-like transposase DDE domain-containing protein n=1 Tax=Aromia moschata TaxID=1265417 RepID=A0AAV8YFJ4_9CUCU|nr:hypothetical protein NQ318_005059 [Aromia moschata]